MANIGSVQIANMALSHVGAKSSIEALSESSPEARQANLWYDHCRLQVLEASDWSFARKRLLLALHGEAPPTGIWAYRYQYPADCIFARRIVNPISKSSDQVPFDIEVDSTGETKTILTDSEEAVLIYTKDVSNPTLFSNLFVDALSHLLASYIGYSPTGTMATKTKEFELYAALLSLASAGNANEQAAAPMRDAPWITGR